MSENEKDAETTLDIMCALNEAVKKKDAEIARLTKFAHIVEHGNWRLVVQINPPSNIVKAEMLNQYGLAIASGEGADAVEAILGANAALEAMPEKKRKEA